MTMKCPECERLRVLAKVSEPGKRAAYVRQLEEHQQRVHGYEPVGLAAGLWKGKVVRLGR